MSGVSFQSPYSVPVRVLVSYAHDNAAHEKRVRRLYMLLRRLGIDAQIDLVADESPQDWPLWMLKQIKLANFVLVIASPEYRRRAEGDAPPDEGRGVQWEARLIRDEVYADQEAALNRFIPVVLPGGSPADIPKWLGVNGSTRYEVGSFSLRGIEKLLRLLTGQPYEEAPPLGAVPILPPRSASAPSATTENEHRRSLLRRLAARSVPRNHAQVQADVRQLLVIGNLGLTEDDLGVSPYGQPGAPRHIDIQRALITIEVRSDLRDPNLLRAAEGGLAAYLAIRNGGEGGRHAAILTDGVEWLLYRHAGSTAVFVTSHVVDARSPKSAPLLSWLDALLATRQQIEPTPEMIETRLGSNSPSYLLDIAELLDIYASHRDNPTVRIKRRLWAKLLTTALGTNFQEEDALFVNHTLLVAMAEIVGHAVVGIALDAPEVDVASMMSGSLFSQARIGGVIEPDFFDWVTEIPEGRAFVRVLSRRLVRFRWDSVEHDIMKVLYESIISPETRHRLGEYYTPDWLADEVVLECVKDPLQERVLDASCGSGTFLFHAARVYLSEADKIGLSIHDSIRGLCTHVVGIDVHPVAVTLARVTYLLAIGIGRLRSKGRPPFTVPVYLADSLRWGRELDLFTYDGLPVSTADDNELFADSLESPQEQLLFPSHVVSDSAKFDHLITELAELATERERYTTPPPIQPVLVKLGIATEDHGILERTFRKMCELHDEERDHIWAYYVRNLARPFWLSRTENKVDVLVGNPPWLAYRYMTGKQQIAFRLMSGKRKLWSSASVATNQDLAGLFVVRCIELYLRPGGRFGYVMPWAALSRQQFSGFRRAIYPLHPESIKVAFSRPWDLHKVVPPFFPVPASVVFGKRQEVDEAIHPLVDVAEVWSGEFATDRASRSDARRHTTRIIGERMPETTRISPYAARFSQGATIVPRVLFVVEDDDVPHLGVADNMRAVRSRRSAFEKAPWKNLPSLRGTIEEEFISALYVGDSILPFRPVASVEAVIPFNQARSGIGSRADLSGYRGISRWLAAAERLWELHRSSDRLTLFEQLDFRRKLSSQFPAPRYRVAYAASGMYIAAAVISDPQAVIEHQLYWAGVDSVEEARYLTAVLNSAALTLAVRPLQSRGEHNPRHFDKHIWRLPIPLYDPNDPAHTVLVALAERAESVASQVLLPKVRFETLRRSIRQALVADGVAADTDAIVKGMLLA